MQRLALHIEYDGTSYAGWQRQRNGIAVQQRVEESLTSAFGQNCIIHGAGRTDSGVHASGQVAHVELTELAHNIPIDKIAVALNTRLPKDIRIKNVAVVPDEFHARFDAVWREYTYSIALTENVFQRHHAWHPEVPFHADTLVETLSVMKGTHDFTAISKHNPSTRSYICNVAVCEGMIEGDLVQIRIRANRFVYGMCRAIVGVAMSAARGQLTFDDVRQLLQSQSRQRAPIIVPAHGLNLCAVSYKFDVFAASQHPTIQ
ncbi:MAG: tRNA pseudouridine(38-40) synthase TruA [Ignavibacteria bacterium]|jgi:tRNA pseudouridine38-40 synthase